MATQKSELEKGFKKKKTHNNCDKQIRDQISQNELTLSEKR